VASEWEIKLELENEFDAAGQRQSNIEPTLVYRDAGLRTHIEFEKPISPETLDGAVEWQLDIHWDFSQADFLIRNELSHNLDKSRTKSEFTPRWYYRATDAVDLGFDLEIDYYDSKADTEFSFFYVELEPTIVWTHKFEKNKLTAKLEAPVTRLYSKDQELDNFKITGVESIVTYRHLLRRKLYAVVEVKLPYDREKDEFEQELNLAVRYRFE